MHGFSLTLAFYEFVPLLLTGAALWFLSRFVHDRQSSGDWFCVIGSILILLGCLAELLWKFLLAGLEMDVAWLGGILLPLSASGVVFIGIALLAALQDRPLALRPGLFLGIGIIAIAAIVAAMRVWLWQIPGGWTLPLLVLAALGWLGMGVLLIIAALRLHRWWIAVLFVVNLVVMFVWRPVTLTQPQAMSEHWTELSLLVVAMGCFAFAANWLWRASDLAEIRERQQLLRRRAVH